jgi:hypothetical protein
MRAQLPGDGLELADRSCKDDDAAARDGGEVGGFDTVRPGGIIGVKIEPGAQMRRHQPRECAETDDAERGSRRWMT